MICKKSFSLLEIIAVITLLGIFYSAFILKFDIKDNKLDVASKRLILYLKHTRIQALLDEKFDANHSDWHKSRWSLKFLRCKKDIGGFYYAIYSDTNKKGQINKAETLKDPLTNQYIYSDNRCEYKNDRSKYVLLTQEFGINRIEISCNATKSLGQLSFGSNGELYSNLSSNENEHYLVKTPCKIIFYNEKGDSSIITIHPESGFIQ